MARWLLVKITFSRKHNKQQLTVSMNKMMSHLCLRTSSTPFIEEIDLMPMAQMMSQSEWQTIHC